MGDDVSHCVGVASEGVDTGLGPHVPDTSSGVPAPSEEHVDGRVEGHAVHCTQVPVIVSDDLCRERGREKGAKKAHDCHSSFTGTILFIETNILYMYMYSWCEF